MSRSIRASVALASLAAGPIFVASAGLAALYLQLPRAVDVTVGPANIIWLLLVPLPVVLAGFLLSFIPNLVGTCLMLLAGFQFQAARSRAAWLGAGALFGTLIAWETTGFEEPATAFGLIATSACCAAICRHSACWD
jgi:hypothetical protein